MTTSNRIVPLVQVKDCFLVYGARYLDSRGFFEELYNASKFDQPLTKSWQQVSLAKSKANVIPGLHCSN